MATPQINDEIQPAGAVPPLEPAALEPVKTDVGGALSTAVAAPSAPREIKPEETTRGQLSSMLEEDSPYIKRARTGAEQYAQRRGLLSSSIAAGAGETAAIEAAAPIASQTAGVYEREAMARQGRSLQSEAMQEQAGIQRGLNEQQFGNMERLEKLRVENQKALMNLDATNRETFARVERDHQLTLQNNASAVNLYGQAMQSINNILSNPDISAAQQQAGVNKQMEFLNNSLTLVNSMSDTEVAFPTIQPSVSPDKSKTEYLAGDEPLTTVDQDRRNKIASLRNQLQAARLKASMTDSGSAERKVIRIEQELRNLGAL